MITIFAEILTSILVVLFLILLYAPILLIHEIGHWLAFRFFGVKAKLRIGDIGDFEMGTESHDKINLAQTLIIALAGIFAGVIPITIYSFFLPRLLILGLAVVYVMGIGLDLMAINQIFTAVFKWKMDLKKTTMFKMNEEQWVRYRTLIKGK